LAGEGALAGAAAIQLGLDIRFGQGQPGGTAVHYDAHRAAMGFAKCRDAKKPPERIAHAAACPSRAGLKAHNKTTEPQISQILWIKSCL